ncbi:MAG: TetR/AcrR family transcriptional regulator [Thermoanaerobaculia bacterium]
MNTSRNRPPLAPPRKEEIIDRTFELVRERGFAGLRMRQIADKVGVTEGALYRHFPSKEAILLALVDRMEGRLLAPIRQIAANSDLSPKQKLEEILRHHLLTVIETRSLPILLLSEASFSEHEELRVRMRRLLSSYLGILESIARETGTTKGFAPRELAVLLLGLPAAVALTQRLLPDEALAERLIGPVAAQFIGLVAE